MSEGHVEHEVPKLQKSQSWPLRQEAGEEVARSDEPTRRSDLRRRTERGKEVNISFQDDSRASDSILRTV